MPGQIIQNGELNIFVNNNFGTINVEHGRPIQKWLTPKPYADERFFIGRSTILLEIRHLMDEHSGQQIIQLFGIGGIGKTTLAEHFLIANESHYNHIALIEDNGSLMTAIGNNLQLADSLILNDDVKGKPARKKFDLVTSRMRQLKGRNLLVIDNTTEELERNEIFNAISLTTDWDILITSREPLLHCIHLRVDELSQEDCRQLFYTHYHYEKNDKLVNEILKIVQYHTLTIEVVSMTSERRIFGLQQILDIVKKKPQTFQKGQSRVLKLDVADIAI